MSSQGGGFSVGAWYITRAVAVLVLVCALLYMVLIFGFARLSVQSGLSAAPLPLAPRGDAFALAAEQALLKNTPAGTSAAISLSRQATDRAPLDARAVRTLGLALIKSGREQEGGQVMLRAGALGWRDTSTQLWLVTQAIYQADAATLVERVDGLLRRQVRGDDMLGLLHRLAADPRIRAAIVARLADEPPWSKGFFSRLERLRPEDLQAHGLLLEEFKDERGQIERAKLAPFVRRMAALGRYEEANRVWTSMGGPTSRAKAGLVADPEFEAVQADTSTELISPFEWRLHAGSAGFAVIGSPPVSTEMSLQAEGDGSAAMTLVEQTVLLGRGAYTLTYDVIAEPAGAGENFEWLLTCLDGRGAQIRPIPTGSTSIGNWRRVNMRFAIPDSCQVQRLFLKAQRAPGMKASRAWFDRVGISRT